MSIIITPNSMSKNNLERFRATFKCFCPKFIKGNSVCQGPYLSKFKQNTLVLKLYNFTLHDFSSAILRVCGNLHPHIHNLRRPLNSHAYTF